MLDELRHLLLIAEHGTFTEAARRAGLSQPALTASIHRLEEGMGARLLHRGRGGASLTAAGEALLPRARAALAAVEDGRRAVAEITGLTRGEVRLGGGATACTYLVPPILAAFRRRYPEVRFLLREAFTAALRDALHDGALDIALVTTNADAAPASRDLAMTEEPWLDDPLILVAAPGVDPATAGFVTFSAGSPTRALLEAAFPAARIVMELGSIAAVKGNVRAGIGMALVSRAAVATDLATGQLAEIPSPRTPFPRRLALLHRGVDRLPPAAAALREMLLAAGGLADDSSGRRAGHPTGHRGRRKTTLASHRGRG
jgi:molybdate transport repressor ModE-like protein